MLFRGGRLIAYTQHYLHVSSSSLVKIMAQYDGLNPTDNQCPFNLFNKCASIKKNIAILSNTSPKVKRVKKNR